MRLAVDSWDHYEAAPPALQVFIDETIIRIVEDSNGIKDTALTIAVLSEVANHPDIQISDNPQYAAVQVSKSIHRLIHNGRLIAIDCDTPKGSFTFVLPGGSKPMIALPIFVTDNRTRH